MYLPENFWRSVLWLMLADTLSKKTTSIWFVGLAILSLVLALVLGGVAKKSSRYEERRTYAGWAIACMVTFFVLFLLADLGTGPIEAYQQALQCVASNLKVSVDEV